MTKRIEIEAEPREKITLSLVGKEYVLPPVKGALMLKIGRQAKLAEANEEKQLGMIDDMILTVFGKKQANAIQKRLEDPEDALDIPHIMKVVEKLSEIVSEDQTPTT